MTSRPQISASREGAAPADVADAHIPVIVDELDALRHECETAAEAILHAADELVDCAPKDAARFVEVVRAQAAAILEACIFNDLAGQRLNKVRAELAHLNDRLKATGAEAEGLVTDEGRDRLINGPQAPGAAPTQAEVDRRFGAG